MREALRKAGDAVKRFDEEYSNKIMDMYVGRPDATTEPNQLLGMLGLFAGGTAMNYKSSERNKAMFDKAKASSFASKYVLPVAGVTLAGKGILDLTAAFGTAADMPEPQQLGLQ